MKPRWILEADYPTNKRIIGSIIDLDDVLPHQAKELTSFYDKYPHLFKRLEWHEELPVDTMPEYVKWIDTTMKGTIEKVEFVDGRRLLKVPSTANPLLPSYFEPSNIEEYNTYIKTKNVDI